ncbi:MAG: RNA polymerase sigma-70 factor [Bacteroidales bacterium]|nr:RNA polymerase sigma-70 factor [Bacteroidales bacterium]
MDTDRQLFELIRKGDREAFDTLFRRWYPQLVAYADRFVPREEAENVVQDVMLALWKRAAATSITSSVSSYLQGAVRNRCLNILDRKQTRERYYSAVRLSVMEATDGIGYASAKELSTLLGKALGELSEEQRRAFEDTRLRGLKYSEAAAEEGVSVKTIEYRMSQALKKLRLALAEWL